MRQRLRRASKFLDQGEFHSAARAGRTRGAAVLRVADGAPEPIAGTRRVRFCFSDGSVDRAGDTVDPTGWDLSAFQRNPVALWAHDSSAPPIGRACNVAVEGGRLMGDIEFAEPDVYEFADTIFRQVKAGFINAVSVGFIPIDYSFSKDPDRQRGIDFHEQELLEISVCPVPANANALITQRGYGAQRRYGPQRRRHLVDDQDSSRAGRSEADLAQIARVHRVRLVRDAGHPDTEAGRAVYAARLRGALGLPPAINPAIIRAEAFYRTGPRW